MIGASCGLLSACGMIPKTVPAEERYQKAQAEVQHMFAHQPPVCGELDFNQAMARGLQFNLDYRIKKANSAIKAGQLRVAEFAMLPELNGTGSVYNRNNNPGSFGSNSDGTPNDQISNGSDRTVRSWRGAVKWNLFDLGMGYVKAREEGERLLIAEEESRKELQKLVQDVRVAYWKAYSAQQLMSDLQAFQYVLQDAKASLDEALVDKIVPKEELLNFQSTMLEGNRRLLQLEDKVDKATQEFRYLINLPIDQPIILKRPPISITRVQNLRNLDFEKLDAITLVNRPELRGQNYQRRIAKLGTKAAIIQALPNITFNHGRNFNSNSFLVENFWNDRSIEASWNILNLAALPVTLGTAKTQMKFETLKLMALTMGALNQTRIAYSHYQNLAKECAVAHKQTENSKRMYRLLSHRESAALSSRQQVVLAKLHYIFAKMDEEILLSELSMALGELYLSSGFDVLPIEATYGTPDEVLCRIEENLLMQDNMDFKRYVNVTYKEIFENCQSEPI